MEKVATQRTVVNQVADGLMKSTVPIESLAPPPGIPVKLRRSAHWLARQFESQPGVFDVDVIRAAGDAPAAFEQFARALRLVHAVYVRHAFILPRPSQLHLNLFLLLPRSRTFVVKQAGEVIGTLSVVLDSPFGLPIDQLYHAETQRLRQGRPGNVEERALLSEFFWDSADFAPLPGFARAARPVLAELTAFALDEQHQTRAAASANVCLELMRVAYKFAVLIGIDTYVIEVTPNHAPFYQQFWGCESFATGKVFPLDGARAVALKCPILNLTKLFADAERHSGGMHSLLLLKKREHDVLTAAMKTPIFPVNLLRYALQHQFHPAEPALWDQISAAERRAFQVAYAPFGYAFD